MTRPRCASCTWAAANPNPSPSPSPSPNPSPSPSPGPNPDPNPDPNQVGGGHIFPNWPTSQTPLGKVECCAFSPGSGYMAVGNHQGKVLLWRLNHYQVI